MKKKMKWIFLATVILVCGVGAVIWMQMPLRLEAVTVTAQTAQLTFTAQGVKSYEQYYHVYPIVSGRIVQVYPREGDVVSAGDLLVGISAEDYTYQIRQLEGTIAAYEAQKLEVLAAEEQLQSEVTRNLQMLQGELKAIRGQKYQNAYVEDAQALQTNVLSNYVKAMADLVDDARNRKEELSLIYKDDPTEENRNALLLAELELRDAENQYRQAQIDYRRVNNDESLGELYFEGLTQSVEAQIRYMEERREKDYTGPMLNYYDAQIEVLGMQIQQLQSQAGNCTLYTGVSGVVVDLPARETNVAMSGQPLATIGVGTGIEVYVALRDIASVRVGDSVVLTFDSGGQERVFDGVVAHVDDKAQVQLSALGVEERRVRVVIEAEEDFLGMGYAVDVTFTTYREEEALVLPKTAVFTDQDGADCVWLIDAEGVLTLQPVTKGTELRAGFVIEEGLAAGQQVVRDVNLSGLAEGKKVASES